MRPKRIARLLAATAALTLAGAVSAQAAQVLYSADGTRSKRSDLLVLDQGTGNIAERVGPNGFSLTGLAQDPTTGTLYGVTSGQDFSNPGFLVTVDKRTGAASLVGDLDPATTNAAGDITFAPNGTLFGWLDGPDDLVTINKATGLATVVGDSGLATGPNVGLASDSQGVLYGALNGDSNPLRTINPATGVVTPVSTLQGAQNYGVVALAFDAQDTLFGIDLNTNGLSAAKLMTITISTGQLSYRPGFGDGLEALAFVNEEARAISLAASKQKVKAGKTVVLSGAISAGNVAGCAAGVAVELLAQSGSDPQAPIATATTAADGSYSATVPVAAKTTFQASADGPAFCQDALSGPVTVKLKKPKKPKKSG